MSNNNLVEILTWIVGIIISLVVGSGMINGTLNIPTIPTTITIASGWVVIISAITNLILTIFKK